MKKLLFFIASLSIMSCEFFQQKNVEDAVARAGDSYLYKADIDALLSEHLSKEDSTLLVNNFIDRWATRQLLMEKAKINLSEEKQRAYEELIENYKLELYTKGYKDIIATRELDSVISDIELKEFYEENKNSFLLNEELIQLRYIHVGTDNTSISKIKEHLNRFNEEDQEELTKKIIQFKTHSLNDSVWVQAVNVLNAIPIITHENFDELLKKSNFIELEDSLGVYLIHIKDVLLRNEVAPLEHVKPTIVQIILNGRKLETIKKIEKDIIEDAIKNKNFEKFN
ncbi:MAG TPA: peptidyl-prolyl cis-trans isomerase [Flavobacteriaceae bacterium]|nr:peptidyl-prolyl cis-trans isomerase [Flavobacteriaceae bacterium]